MTITKEHLETILKTNETFRYYKSMESLFEIDQWSVLPQGGNAYRQQMTAFVAGQKAMLFHHEEAKSAATYFESGTLDWIQDDIERASIQRFLFRYNQSTKADATLVKQYNSLRADAMSSWKQAREAKDWTIFLPYLEQVFDLKRRIALSINPEAPAIETLVGMTDEGVSCKEIDREFNALKTELPKLIHNIAKKDVGATTDLLMTRSYDPTKLELFCKEICGELGYVEAHGGYNNKVIHAFTSFVGPRDARINTYQSDRLGLIFTYIHECGHAMHANSGNTYVNKHALWGGIEGGFHEAMARFYENMVGRSQAFWEYALPKLQHYLPELLDIPVEVFYKGINKVQPSLKRIGADEVTYNLHGIIRYELERDCLNQTLQAKDLREAWNEKYKSYLGVVPTNDTEGILQDMHWAGDYIGYFQSYVLGNIYDGQIIEVLGKQYPTMYEDIRRGRFDTLSHWMTENIHQYGCCYTSTELLHKLTGKGLDVKPFINYLEKKYIGIE